MPMQLKVEEAQALLDGGGAIITSGGYIYVSDGNGTYYYCAYGVWPGCLRTGPRPDLAMNHPGLTWSRLTLKEIILKKGWCPDLWAPRVYLDVIDRELNEKNGDRSEEHTSELQSRPHLVCRL